MRNRECKVSKKTAIFSFVIFLICIALAACSGSVSKKLVAQIDLSRWVEESFTVSSDIRRVAYVISTDGKQCVVVNGEQGKQYDSILKGTPIFSPDSKRLAYGARVDAEQFVVVDGEEGKRYDLILDSSLVFSPDSKRLAYIAANQKNVMVVVDGVETKAYGGVFYGTRPVFDSPTRLHTLLRSGSDLEATLVEVDIVEE